MKTSDWKYVFWMAAAAITIAIGLKEAGIFCLLMLIYHLSLEFFEAFAQAEKTNYRKDIKSRYGTHEDTQQ